MAIVSLRIVDLRNSRKGASPDGQMQLSPLAC
jgi:hypothetical protein